jgi:hypothetical protein
VTLHACDTATDEAILFAIKHKAEQMMFVPCCQHELNQQLCNSESQSILKHGILRDRLTSIITDSLRALIIEILGYKVQVLEFIDLEETSKNVLIRCRKKSQNNNFDQLFASYQQLIRQWDIDSHLMKELRKIPDYSGFNF